jgi:hypothetical protein
MGEPREPTKPGHYWAKANFVKEHAQEWVIVEVSGNSVWVIGSNMPFDLADFTFGPEVTKPEGLE